MAFHKGDQPSGEAPATAVGDEMSLPGRALVRKKGRHFGGKMAKRHHGKRKMGKRG
jgi:hypothetical protein